MMVLGLAENLGHRLPHHWAGGAFLGTGLLMSSLGTGTWGFLHVPVGPGSGGWGLGAVGGDSFLSTVLCLSHY